MAKITAELVVVERPPWRGKATLISAQTIESEIGVLPGYQPLFSQLVNSGTVTINIADGKVLVASVQGGFTSVPTSKVLILVDKAIRADRVNFSEAESNPTSDGPAVKVQAESEVCAARRTSTN